MTSVSAGLWKRLFAFQVYGANTGVGKTVISTAIARHLVQQQKGERQCNVQFLKPVSTGPIEDADYRYVEKYAGCATKCLYQYSKPVSPHIAARSENLEFQPPSDDILVRRVSNELEKYVGWNARATKGKRLHVSIVETAGGVLSPGPSGTPQADIYRALRLPVLLVGDHRLGGIAATISAFESLTIRGYDVDAIVLFESGQFGNSEYLKEYFARCDVRLFTLPSIMSEQAAPEDHEYMVGYYDKIGSTEVPKLTDALIGKHFHRFDRFGRLQIKANEVIWHPFTQHKNRQPADIMPIDSAYGDFFQVGSSEAHMSKTGRQSGQDHMHPALKPRSMSLQPKFDGSASWWTQGLGHGNPDLALATAYAAGRYGHVMFAGAVHEPALTLSKRLLSGLNNPRLQKVFFSDDGSTAIEVGIKMALKAASRRYGWDGSEEEIGIIGLKGSYHGDTIGAMDTSEPSVYNKKVEWYRGRGHWFDFPQVKMRDGKWYIEPPIGMEDDLGPSQTFEHLDDILDLNARDDSKYMHYIEGTLNELISQKGRKFGALLMEPVILGAGGMLFADPLFQRALVKAVRNVKYNGIQPTPVTPTTSKPKEKSDEQDKDWTGLPVIFDEVFTGLYRLGRFSSASFLQAQPDISVHAKLLTGGILPMSVTVASQSIFNAFSSDNKADALLHGHSYTAHAIGCHVANVSLSMMENLAKSPGGTWSTSRTDWNRAKPNDPQLPKRKSSNIRTWSIWSSDTVAQISRQPNVDHVIALGSVMAIALKDESGAGYTSDAAAGLRDSLFLGDGNYIAGVHSRVLGNVIYFMASMTSKRRDLGEVESLLLANLQRMGSGGDAERA